MVARLACCIALVVVTSSSPSAGGIDRSAQETRGTSPPARSVKLEGTGYEVRFAAPGAERPNAPPPALVRAIVVWLSRNFSLPASDALPGVKLVPRAHIAAFRHTGVLSDDPHALAAIPAGQREVVAVYDELNATIYLPADWSGSSPAEVSALVHEVVHHLQSVARLRYACPQEREALAYAAQEKWLGLFGGSLADDFDIDPFTLLVSSRCPY